MEDRESSTASSVDFYDSEKPPEVLPEKTVPIGDGAAIIAKRKAEDLALQEETKKRRLDPPSATHTCNLKPCAGLPPALWQHVFLFCSLHDLGRLLQVNRSFRSYLIDVCNVPHFDPASGLLRLLKSESIWASARNALPVKPPKPLPGFSELRMWQLALSKQCQFCRKVASFISGEKLWQKGPGSHGVRTIWPFGIKACGSCIMDKCQTDASLLFSSASALRPALPFAFVTTDRNYIPAYTLQAATTPATVEIVKYYYKQHVEDITKELNEALGLGSAAAEEWYKGLEARGSERMKIAEHWERWEAKYQWWMDHREPKRASSATPIARSPVPVACKEVSISPIQQKMSPIIYAPVPAGKSPLGSNLASNGNLLQRFICTPPSASLTAAATPSQYLMSRSPTVPQQRTPGPGSVQPGRGERNLHDVNEAKAYRKADIERRCQHMKPPIPPNILRHMDSFKAALQISQPMTDYAWSVLQPRLLAQLPAAQQAEADHVSRVACTSKMPERRPLEHNSKEAKETMDREWDEAQRPIRDKLSTIADQFINQDWGHGDAVTYENSPKFAVDVLVHVRRTFYAQIDSVEDLPGWKPNYPVTEDAGDTRRPRLILENMKWVYDNKIKPTTEQFRKEIFLCYGNGCEGNTKFYGFEGVIQHFGAKHTNAFSVGNVVVAWREAEWPEETPFHPDPISVKHAYHAAPSASGHPGYGTYYGGYSRAGTSTPHIQSHLPQASPGPYHYASHYNGPFAPPQMHAAATPGYDYSQSYNTQMDAYQYQSMAASSYGQPPGNGYMTSPAMSNPVMAALPTGQRHVPSTIDTLHKVNEGDHRTSLYDKQVSTVIKIAHDLWKHTSGVQDLPNSLRIYVLLQRVIAKFHAEFNYEPKLNHFIDAFSNHEIPRALKSAPGLFCKACNHLSPQSQTGQEERRAFTSLNLFLHFKSQHSGSQGPYGSGQLRNSKDWKEDMIELPSDRQISGLIRAVGMDDDKLLTVATVFPSLFPTPLPKVGVIDGTSASTTAQSLSGHPKEASKGEASASATDKSGPSSLASYIGSPQPNRSAKEEYDPQRPALPGNAEESAAHINKKYPHRGSPSLFERRGRYYTESQYLVPTEHTGRDYYHSEEPLEYATSPRRFRESRPYYEEYHGRRPMYRDQESFYHPSHEEVLAQPRDGAYVNGHRPPSRQIRYMEQVGQSTDYRYAREVVRQERDPQGGKSEADRFLEEFAPSRPPTTEQLELSSVPRAEHEPEDSSRYTPSPANQAAASRIADERLSSGLPPPVAPYIKSNGSRYEEYRADRRQMRTPDSGRGSRRPGPQRRRDRQTDHMPSRYYRYMSVARDEPYSRGASISRSQSKRYEDTRRRIDQQETPQPNPDPDHIYSRDHSVEQGLVEEAPQGRLAPREYISVQDRLHHASHSRYRYEHPEEARGPPPVYVDEYGQRIHEYEIIRVPRDPHPTRGAYMTHASARYVEHEGEDLRNIAYDRPPLQRYDGGGRPEYVYYEERERPPPVRRPAYEADTAYEAPPPEIKVEAVAPIADAL